MQMLVDAALITKKAVSADYNTDSVNASGKVWPRDVVHSDSGIKAAGKSQGKPYYVLASADAKGTAESAADLFRNCLSEFNADGSNYSVVISDFFKAFAKVLSKTGFDSSACDLCIFSGIGSDVYLGKSGKSKLYRYADGVFSEAVPQMFKHIDNKSFYGVCSFSDVRPGEIFLLVTGKVAANISDSLFKAICTNAAGDIKKIIALIASNAAKNGCTEAVSAIALKIEETGASVTEIPGFVPPVSVSSDEEEKFSVTPEAASADAVDTEADVDEDAGEEPDHENPFLAEVSAFAAAPVTKSAETVEYNDDEEETTDEPKEKKRIFRLPGGDSKKIAVLNIAVIAVVLIAALALILAKGVFKKKPDPNIINTSFEDESTTESESASEDESTTGNTEESTTAQEPTSGVAPVSERATNNASQSTTIRNREEAATRTVVSTTERPTEPPTQRPTPVTEPPTSPEPVTEPEPVTDPVPVTDPEPVTDPVPVTDPEPLSSMESETVDRIPDGF